MSAARITVGVDGNSQMGICFEGSEDNLLALLGAMDYAKRWVGDRIQKRVGDGIWNERQVQDAPRNNPVSRAPVQEEYHAESRLRRDKAVEATEYAIQVLQLRVESMKKAPGTSEFLIDSELLSRL